jgi:hypothetical protein
LVLAAAWAALGITAGRAAADATPGPFPGLAYLSELETDKGVYQLGEEVQAVHRFTNQADADYRLQKNTTPVFDLWVLDDQGKKIWSQYMVILPGNAGWLTVVPGESVVHEYTWDMTDYQGNLVAPGTYELVGVMYGGFDARRAITVVPEPATMGLVLLGVLFVTFRRRTRR